VLRISHDSSRTKGKRGTEVRNGMPGVMLESRRGWHNTTFFCGCGCVGLLRECNFHSFNALSETMAMAGVRTEVRPKS
jgi:hypothetical protein